MWPYIACGVLDILGGIGILSGSGIVSVIGAGVLGFATAAILIFMLTLPPQLSPPDDIHRMTAGMFTISYSFAVIVPIVSGLLWDLTGIAATAFIPIGLCALLLMALSPSVRPRDQDSATQS